MASKSIFATLPRPFKDKPSMDKPKRRAHHCAVSVGDSLYVWGGNQNRFAGVHDNEEKRKITSTIQHFTPSTGQWITRDTAGTPPLGVIEYCCTAINDLLYYFGGACGHGNCYHNSITQLDTVSLQWRELEPTDATRPVMRRGYGGMISFKHDGVHHLLMIGGRGSKPAVQLPHYKYIELPHGNWHTNEHSIYNISSKKWSTPLINGQCIPPAESFIIEKINNTRAILFGGVETIDGDEDAITNNIYILEISLGTVVWQCIKKPEAIDQWPVGRYNHGGAIVITGSDFPILVISGGKDKDGHTLDDYWIFNITQHSWIKLDVPKTFSLRYAHSLSSFVLSPHCALIVTVGGRCHDSTAFITKPNIAMLNFIDNKGEWTVGDTLDTNGMNNEEYKKKYQQQLQTGRRIEEHEEPKKGALDTADIEQTVQTLIQNLQEKEREAQVFSQQLEQKEREEAEKDQEIRRYCHQLQEKDREHQVVLLELQEALQQKDIMILEKDKEHQVILLELQEALQQKDIMILEKDNELQVKDREVRKKHKKLKEMNMELEALQEGRELQLGVLQEKDRELQEKDRELQEKDREHQVALQELQEKDEELRQSQDAVRRYQQQAELTDDHWVINKDEVTLTDEELGRGAYAVVTVGIFRGLRVAVKSLHTIIISNYNLALFSREMTVASQIRHPNLVQFIGATRVGNPLILTELMSTSLNQELQRNQLTNQQILSIAQDVALGLNYLHLFQPPIIHRDVSSPNVLLKPCTGPAGYEAKVADYGTVKVVEATTARTGTGPYMPGNPAYAAPEARDPDQHSPAMDVYSYSVLLMEMNLCRPPEMETARRARQSGSVSWSDMKSLIQRGLKVDPKNRPTMAQVLEFLKRIKI
ncbi:PREDICTED: uncharacterized protein LOC109588094 isoform X1 [Amphimedon queenslandica]|uniref:Protein kinase domain-containing protein n=1 Tax=Amphimedon queenslandica TaxID=400682 RepID=A0AAN0JSI6_AMPQE|nr:PREDICTED: uncharacterized protein LOC109588094 isoform X1 [Amphimedon queenslandica]|eukprot:XP_019859841.1 PREDICTED: uncharacterized protein LOC109588094 isoform X1 [Amphimedon queenslandica]